MSDNPILRPVEKAATDKRRDGNPSVARWRGICTRSRFPAYDKSKLNGPSKLTLPMGIEPTFSELTPDVLSRLNYGNIRHPPAESSTDVGRGLVRGQLALRLREVQLGKWRDRTEAFHAGNRTRTAKAFAADGTPSFWWKINDQLRPIEMVRATGFAPAQSASQAEMLTFTSRP